MILRWKRLPHTWKTGQAFQAIQLLKEYRIKARTEPDEFNGLGNYRMMLMDQDIQWPIYVRAGQSRAAREILQEEHLL